MGGLQRYVESGKEAMGQKLRSTDLKFVSKKIPRKYVLNRLRVLVTIPRHFKYSFF